MWDEGRTRVDGAERNRGRHEEGDGNRRATRRRFTPSPSRKRREEWRYGVGEHGRRGEKISSSPPTHTQKHARGEEERKLVERKKPCFSLQRNFFLLQERDTGRSERK